MSADRFLHILVSASAGSGKTYSLVQRYAHLLAHGQMPENIAAMTFTKKAAGEFFNRILRRLAELATGECDAAAFFEGMDPPLRQTPSFAGLLRRVTRRIHRLRLGTMDSFFATVTACFPLELGLPLGACVMSEEETRQARLEALEALLERIYIAGDDRAAGTLLEGFKQATFGAEEKSIDENLQSWIDSGHAMWLESGGSDGWGNVSAIWGDSSWLLEPADSLDAAVEVLGRCFPKTTAKGAEMLEDLMEQLPVTEPGLAPPKRVAELLEKCAPDWQGILAGAGEITWGRKVKIEGEAARALVRVVRLLLARELLVRAARTQGIAAVVSLYESEYQRRVRSRGRLSFADVQRLLADAAEHRQPWTAGAESELWFRLDGRYDHWLFDEFQDTSFLQWRVVRELVDEVIQSDAGDRSFFAVGDPKQSIYLWRQAEPGLFDDVRAAYPKSGDRGIQEKSLSCSYRSAQAVLDAVNAVFDNSRGEVEALLPGCLDGWRFEPHVAHHKQMQGFAALVSPGSGDDKEDGSGEDGPASVIAGVLRAVSPIERGWTCAVLVRSNKRGMELTQELRATTGMDVVCEAEAHPTTDNAPVLALLSLLQLAAHPGDTLALEHLRMTPLWPVVSGRDDGWRRTLAVVQREVFDEGFAGFAEHWTERLKATGVAFDAFHGRRLRQFVEIAAEFDETGSRDLDAFLEFARNYPLRVRGARNAVQVMTVHASKGLEFDMVIVAELDGRSMTEAKSGGLIVKRERGRIQWVLQEPRKCYSVLDAQLSDVRDEERARAGFESLCRLYVAMTRAKRGLYLVAAPPPRNASALKPSRFLRERLGCGGEGDEQELGGERIRVEWEHGLRTWYEEKALQAAKAVVPPAERGEREALGILLRRLQPMPRRRTPSGEEAFRVKGSVLFSEGREPGRQLGSLVHLLLAEVDWLDGGRQTAWPDHWRRAGLLTGGAVDAEAETQALGVLGASACAEAFARPGRHAEAWRERSFDLVIKGEWVSGVFDRVLIDRAAPGDVKSAWIVDFKTDEVADGAALESKLAGYAPQIALYRQAVSRLTGLKPDAIRASLLFTRLRRLIEV